MTNQEAKDHYEEIMKDHPSRTGVTKNIAEALQTPVGAQTTPDCPFEPRGNMVILKRFTRPEQFEGTRIARPQNQQAPMDTGEVVGIGPGSYNERGEFIRVTQLELGDIVNFISNAGREVEDGTTEWYHIPAPNIISRRKKDEV